MISERLILFTRYPETGKTKPRLIPALGAEGAADLHRHMAEQIMAKARELKQKRGVEIVIRYEDGDEARVREWLGPAAGYVEQGEGDLGARMARAFQASFDAGATAAILIGTDVPGITTNMLDEAFEALHNHDLVLGPAEDGGYYLVGLREPVPMLFEGVAWSTHGVLEQTRLIARELELSSYLLRELADMDRPEDLASPRIDASLRASRVLQERISVIIPTLGEVHHVGAAIDAAGRGENVEIIVADGGSRDGTKGVAFSSGASIVLSRPGRARQMNAGAAEATGGILLFLHADTLLPAGYEQDVRKALSTPGVVAGAFTFRITGDGPSLRFIERMTNWRSRHLQLPYGDQALFLKKSVFDEMGGFPDMVIMEDYEFVRRLKRRGRIVTVPSAAETSGRRWKTLGVSRTTLINQMIIAGYHLHIPPARLARFYRRRNTVQ